MGMLRSGLDRLRDVVCSHSERSAEDVIFGDELRALATDGRLRLVEQHTDSAGRLDVEALAALCPTSPSGRLRPAGRAACSTRSRSMGRGRARRPPAHRAVQVELAEPGEGGTVTFTKDGTVLEVDSATPILDAGEEAGVLMPPAAGWASATRASPLRQRGARPALRRPDHRRPRRRRARPDLRLAPAGACDIDL